jgi:hypothetical protein
VSPRVRAAVEAVMVYGLLGWVYVAVYAAARPDELSQPIAALVPLRRDTFGALAFAASAVAATVLRGATGRLWAAGPEPARGWPRAILQTVAGYGVLVWIYLCANSLTHPWTLSQRLTHFASWPTEGSTAVAGFAASAIAFFLLRSAAPPRQDGCGEGGGDG